MRVQPKHELANEIDLLLVPRQVYEDTLALMVGRLPSPLSRRSQVDSRALVDRLLDCWRILPSLPAHLFEQPLKPLMEIDQYARLRRCWRAVSALAKARFVAVLPLIATFRLS